MVFRQLHYTKRNRFMPFLLAEILNFQGSTHRYGVGSFSNLYLQRHFCIQGIPESISEKVDAQDRYNQKNTCWHPGPGFCRKYTDRLSIIQDVSPGCSWRLYAKAKETLGRFCQDCLCCTKRKSNDNRCK